MLFTNDYISAMAQVLASNIDGLGAGSDLKLALFTNDVTPDATTTIADLTLQVGDGLGAKSCTAGDAGLVWNSDEGVYGFLLNEPAGGFNFLATAVETPNVTIYGYALINDGGPILIAAARFTTPVVIDRVGKLIALSAVAGYLAGPFIGDAGSVVPTVV